MAALWRSLTRQPWPPSIGGGLRSVGTGSSPLCQAAVAPVTVDPLPDPPCTDPFKVAGPDIATLYKDIVREFDTDEESLRQAAAYYFDGKGKAFRPAMVVLMARALNQHVPPRTNVLRESQHALAMITEMLHTASLVHDDVVDVADTRRSKPSVNVLWGVKKAVLSGDYILGVTGMLLASIGNDDVTEAITQAMKDLVDGELMQLEPPDRGEDRFAHYLQKSYNKTASLLSNSCKAAAILAGADPETQEAAFQYGRHVGIAFQLIDDLLDFVASQQDLGKPAGADLQLGLATGPVLFAAETYPELNDLIQRKFSKEGDVETAFYYVLQSNGLERTRKLANEHGKKALQYIQFLQDSREKQALITLVEKVLTRNK